MRVATKVANPQECARVCVQMLFRLVSRAVLDCAGTGSTARMSLLLCLTIL